MQQLTGHSPTDRGARYGRQLCGHFSAKVDATWEGDSGHVDFPFGRCRLTATPNALRFDIEADTEEEARRVAAVVEDHLIRFGARDDLTITWAAT